MKKKVIKLVDTGSLQSGEPPKAKLAVDVKDLESANTTAVSDEKMQFKFKSMFPQAYEVQWDNVKTFEEMKEVFHALNITIMISDEIKEPYMSLLEKGFIKLKNHEHGN